MLVGDNEVVNTEGQEGVVMEGDLQSPQIRERMFHSLKEVAEWMLYTTAKEVGMKCVRNGSSLGYLIQYKEGF